MSQETLDILNQQKRDMIELSPNSEEFTVSGGSSFFGIFDGSYEINKLDSGNVPARSIGRVIIVAEDPGIVKDAEITREDGVTVYRFKRIGKDDEGMPVLWLY